MTDEEALRIIGNAPIDCYGRDDCDEAESCHKDHPLCQAAYDHIRARLTEKPKVTKKQLSEIEASIGKTTLCFGLPISLRDEIIYHILSILGLEVEA